MKKTLLFLLAIGLLTFSACKDDPYPLELQTFDVRWFDNDNSLDQSIDDALSFGVQINSTDPDPDRQYITDWEFAYYVNDLLGGILNDDHYTRTNSLFFDSDIVIDNLWIPGSGALVPGDVIEFRLWARDNHGTELEHVHRYVIEN